MKCIKHHTVRNFKRWISKPTMQFACLRRKPGERIVKGILRFDISHWTTCTFSKRRRPSHLQAAFRLRSVPRHHRRKHVQDRKQPEWPQSNLGERIRRRFPSSEHACVKGEKDGRFKIRRFGISILRVSGSMREVTSKNRRMRNRSYVNFLKIVSSIFIASFWTDQNSRSDHEKSLARVYVLKPTGERLMKLGRHDFTHMDDDLCQ